MAMPNTAPQEPEAPAAADGDTSHTSASPADEAFPPFAEAMTRIGRERGWPPTTRAQFDASATLRGANFVGDPSAVSKAYARLFEERGGRFLRGDATSLGQARGGWQVRCTGGPIVAGQVVVAMGPWSDDVFRPLGYRLPFGTNCIGAMRH